MGISSKISWLDFSESDRRKMTQVISLFKQRDTRDEMGLARIRDGFADMFFPGTTTIQTRAKYFLFVPWSYLYLEKRKTASSKIQERMRKEERKVMEALQKPEEKVSGVIGQRSGRNLQRFPSSIYWNGLRTWEILRYPGPQYQYHRSLDRYYAKKSSSSDYVSSGNSGEVRPNWDPNIPDPPSDFPDEASFELTKEESEYLSEQLLLSCNQSLLAFLVNHMSPAEADFVWLHPEKEAFTQEHKTQLFHARNFSETMHGTALLYNLMLAEKRGSEELIDEFRERLSDWHQSLQEREPALLSWDRDAFWMLISSFNVYGSTRKFVNDWLGMLLDGNRIADPVEDDAMRNLVYQREYRLKRNRSRLENRRHLELWSGDAGTSQLDFRWDIGNDIASDIQRGLGRGS